MKDPTNKCNQLAHLIQTSLEKGLVVSQRDWRFILSTLPIDHITELRPIIENRSEFESDSIIELIFFPDESIQISLEEYLESVQFHPEDEPKVLSCVLSEMPITTVRFQDLDAVFRIDTPENGVRTFLTRLHITRHLDPALKKVINKKFGPEQGKIYKVWIRNMTTRPGEKSWIFLKDLFATLGNRQNRFDNLLQFSLRFLEETPEGADLCEALLKNRQWCLHHLQRLHHYETNSQNKNFETQTALGIRMPYADKQALYARVAIIDEISLALFGRSV